MSFGTFRFLQLHFGKAVEAYHIHREACYWQQQNNKWHKESITLKRTEYNRGCQGDEEHQGIDWICTYIVC